MQADDGGSVYLRLSTRTIAQPMRTLSAQDRTAITTGAYWLAPPAADAELAIVYAGPVAPEAMAAHEALLDDIFDEIVQVTGPEAIEASLKMAEMEGLFTGISGGASMAAALKVADTAPEGSTILTMLPDTAERYLSTPLFEGIEADMNEEEVEISHSTDGQHMPVDA